MSENLKEWIKDIAIAFAIAFAVLFFLMPTVVREHSMESTLNENDYLFVSRQAYTIFGQEDRGDIIVFQSSLPMSGSAKGKLLVKRIVAVGGDTISIHDGYVYLNGEKQEEYYTKDGITNGDMEETVIPEGYLFCMGDNRLVSRDSRDSAVGLVSVDDVKGKVVYRLFPLKNFGSVYK